ncbi:MAG TPA: T9SS type A sorting domain-containing protein [Bacteroidia bacterium]|nr:T9SS type A sorting domain-containing protein [Bacteroidia bacterium]
MRYLYTALLCVVAICAGAQGFNNSATNWNCPNGGDITSGVTNGYNAIGGTAVSTDNTGSQSWSVMDMDGDGYPDLVVTAQLQGGNVTSFSPSSNQYWKVYTGNGTGFSSNAINWSCPNGGTLNGGVTYGFNGPGGFALTSHNTGSQSWSVIDMNHDNKPDLVVTAQLQGGNVTSFSPSSNQYWKVYLNTGSGFSTSAINWNCPNGGDITSGVTNGYNAIGGTAISTDDTGSQSWTVMDMDGDGYLDLVVTAQLQGGNVTSFSPSGNQYWKVYTGNGIGFSSSAINWNCPNGGTLNGGITYGYNGVGGYAFTSHNTGSQTWNTMDMNHDNKPDLVVCAQLQGGNVTSFSPSSNQYWKVYLNNGSGFSTSAINWNCPNGGDITSGVTNGYNAIGGTAVSTDDTGSQSWSVMDLDGDGYLDLVVTAQLQGGNVTSFSPSANQYWKVFAGNGSSFSSGSVNWGCPNGGTINGGITYGYNGVGGYAFTSHNTGSQTWSTMDMNHDNKPDLIVCAQLQGGNVTSFSPSSNQYWKVYLNTSNVGLGEVADAGLTFTIFPNPAGDVLHVSQAENGNLIVGYEIFDSKGSLMMSNNKLFHSNIQIPIQALPSGIYIVKLIDSKSTYSKLRFVKE